MTTGSINRNSPGILACVGNTALVPRYSYVKTWSGGDGAKTDFHPYRCSISSIDRGWIKRTNASGSTDTGQSSYEGCFGAGYHANCSVPGWTTQDQYRLLGRIWEAYRGYDFNAGVALGTGNQTIRLITENAERIRNALHAVRHYDRKAALAALRGRRFDPPRRKPPLSIQRVSAEWLGISYGWLPLLSDVHNGAQALAAELDRVNSSSIRAHVTLRSTGPCSTSQVSRRSRSLIYRFSPGESGPSILDRLGFTNPATTAWDLALWSYAMDWFLPIGDFLELQPLRNMRGEWCQTDYTYKMSFVRSGHRWKSGAYYFQVLASPRRTSIAVNRTVGTGGLAVPLPSFVNPFTGVRRLANQLASASQFIHSISR